MNYEKFITLVNVRFYDLYIWGSGWKSTEHRRKWHEFWDHFNEEWPCQHVKMLHDCDYLCSSCGNMYLHPDESNVFIENNDDSTVESLLKHLDEIMNSCANYCNVEYKIFYSRNIRVDFGNVKNFMEYGCDDLPF